MTEPAAAFSHLTVARIVAEASRTGGAFFHHWESRDAYLEDLIAAVVDVDKSAPFAEFERAAGAALGRTGSLSKALVDGARAGLRSSESDPRVALEMLLWSRAARDESLRKRFAELNRSLDAANSQVVEALMAATGRRPRPPFTAESIAALVGAITQGLTLRRVIDPDVMPEDVMGWILLYLVPMMTSEAGDERTPWEAAPDVSVESAGADPESGAGPAVGRMSRTRRS